MQVTWCLMMATLILKRQRLAENTAYHLVRRAQTNIAGYRHFHNGDLIKYQDRDSFQVMADRLLDKYFSKSRDLQISAQIKDIYLCLLIMSPVLQRLPLSHKFDWHRGHLMGFVRLNASRKIGRFHASVREVERRYLPDTLAANLENLGIHDAGMVAVLMDLYRRHCGGTALKDQLANLLFDPIMLSSEKHGYELRYGNRLYRFEKYSHEGSIDLRRASMKLLDFEIKSTEHKGGRHLEIYIAEPCIASFRQQVNSILQCAAPPSYKVQLIAMKIRDFVERIRSARSAKLQILDLKRWLANRLRSLAATDKEAKQLPELLVNLWLQRCDHRLYLKAHNFFMDPFSIDEKTYLNFYSPYREVTNE